MLLEFKVKNFLSFKDEQVLSFEASDDNSLEDLHCIEVKPGVRILKTAMIYGANASGKTNVLKALEFVHKIALSSKRKRENTGFVPFKFNNECVKKPGYFELSFYIDEIKYVYNITIDSKIIYEEKLIYYPYLQPALVFHRKYDKREDNFTLDVGSKMKLKAYEVHVLKANTTNVSTIISSYTKTNINFEELGKVFRWFEKFRNIIFPDNLYELAGKSVKIPEYKDFLIENLRKADFNITDIETIKNYSGPPDIHFHHTVKNKEGDLKTVVLKEKQGLHNNIYEGEESLGTKQLVTLLLELNESIANNNKLGIDELDSSLHTELLYHYVKLFLHNTKKVSSQMQLIFTTHNISLLNSDLIRKDIVWFSEKKEDGRTELKCLEEFNIRRKNLISEQYKKGNFGAIPDL